MPVGARTRKDGLVRNRLRPGASRLAILFACPVLMKHIQSRERPWKPSSNQ